MFSAGQRVKVDLSGMVVQGVSFSQNVREAIGTIVRQTSTEPPVLSARRAAKRSATRASALSSITTR